MLKDNKIPEGNPGLFAVVMNEAARRARFAWRKRFADYPPLEKSDNATWTDILLWAIDSFDIGLEKWSKSVERMAMGISYPEGYFQADVILVSRSKQAKQEVNLWALRNTCLDNGAGSVVFTVSKLVVRSL